MTELSSLVVFFDIMECDAIIQCLLSINRASSNFGINDGSTRPACIVFCTKGTYSCLGCSARTYMPTTRNSTKAIFPACIVKLTLSYFLAYDYTWWREAYRNMNTIVARATEQTNDMLMPARRFSSLVPCYVRRRHFQPLARRRNCLHVPID